jgi:hypothetical protein
MLVEQFMPPGRRNPWDVIRWLYEHELSGGVETEWDNGACAFVARVGRSFGKWTNTSDSAPIS